MFKKANITKNIDRIISGALVLVMMLFLIIPGIHGSLADPTEAVSDAEILYFEPDDTVIGKIVETGTALENVGLPDELRAVLAPASDNETVGNVTVSKTTATGTSLAGGKQAGEPDVIMASVPVTWVGYYDGDIPGVYTLTAHVDGYTYDGETPTAIVTVKSISSGTGSISGFLWIDGNGMQPNDWNGLYNDEEWPLMGYSVYLHAADDLTHVLAATMTDMDGKYVFDNLAPGGYVLEVRGESVNGVEYLPPIFVTSDNKFAIDWSVSGLPAYTTVIELAEGQALTGINAGMRYPMGIAPFAATTLANLANANINDTLYVDNNTWVVVKKDTVGTGQNKINAVYLIMRGGVPTSQKFGTSVDYNTSGLRTRMNSYYDTKRWPTIGSIALVPNIGTNHSSRTALTLPTAVMASAGSKDVYFAPSLADMVEWTGVPFGKPIPSYHPLRKGAPDPFPTRFWFRTSRNDGEVFGYLYTANLLEGGISHNGTSQIWETPGVWVNAGSVDRNVTVHYIDTAGKPIGSPNSKSYPVAAGNAFSLPSNGIPNITDYKYSEWRKSQFGAPENFSQNPALTQAEVLAGKDLYLVYADDSAHKVTIHHIDESGNSIGVPPTTYEAHAGGDIIPDIYLTVNGYRYTGFWKEGSIGSPSRDDKVEIKNITKDIDVYLIFTKILTQVASGEKNAYIKGSATAGNGSASNPVTVESGDSIRYTITADNNKLSGIKGASYDVMFVLDWSESMGSNMVSGQSARLYERDIMLDMSDFILKNYPNSRISVMAMNSTGKTNKVEDTYIQLQTDFLNKTQFESEWFSIKSAFESAPRNGTEDLVTFLKAANHRMEGLSPVTYGSNAGGGVVILPRSDRTRTPVIIMISDFQIPAGQKVGNENYWESLMLNQSRRFETNSSGGILLTVRLDHYANTTGNNSEYSNATFDTRMRTNISPRGNGKWGFTKVSYGTSYTDALRNIKSDFIKLAPPGADLGTVITDKVPEGLDVDIGSISHKGVYDPVTRIITWDLSEANNGKTTVEFTATVAKAPGSFRNTAYVVYYDSIEGSTNTTYHEAALRASVDVTIGKTLTGDFANKNTRFTFTVYLVDITSPGAYAGKAYTYIGGVINGTGADAPENGVLVLSDDGNDNAKFRLSHGQTITIKNVPVDAFIMVIETPDETYTTWVLDSTDNSITDNYYTQMQPVGYEDRRFDFINNRDGVVPTGVDSGTMGMGMVVLPLSAIALIASGMTGIALIKRKQAADRN